MTDPARNTGRTSPAAAEVVVATGDARRPPHGVSGVRHAGDVLALFTTVRPEWGAADAGRALGLSRSHSHRLLATLADIGLLVRIEPARRYRLSMSCFSYMAAVLNSDRLFCVGVPTLDRLARLHAVTPLLAVWARGMILTVRPSPEPAFSFVELRRCLAAGVVLLAGLPEDEFNDAFASVCRTESSSTVAEVERQVRHVRQRGRVVWTDPSAPDSSFLAMPVMDQASRVIAAVVIPVPQADGPPSRRLTIDLERAANAISRGVAPQRPLG